MSRPEKDTGQQWAVLRALSQLPPFGQTSASVAAQVGTASSSGTRTRLKEMADMGLVSSFKPDGSKYTLYLATEMGYKLLAAGDDGKMALVIMRNTHTVLEAQRAAELAPIKERWQRIIENQMHMIAGTMV